MNFVVGFVILFCLFCSEYSAVGSAGHLRERIGGIVLLTCLVPGLAFLQTVMVRRKVQQQEIDQANWERLCRRVSSCHSAVWLAASVATIYAFRWHDVVRADWGLGRFVLVDEILILGPVLFSLLASWAVFFDLKPKRQSAVADVEVLPPTKPGSSIHTLAAEPSATSKAGSWFSGIRAWVISPGRREFVSIRFRLYILVLMVPLLLAIVANDLATTASHSGPVVLIGLLIAGVLVLLVLLPTMAGLPWKLTKPSDQVGEVVLHELAQLTLVKPKFRVWETGDQIVNAAAVGMLPWFRQLWISDRLIRSFSEIELRAIVRHEVAHLQLSHAAIRSALLLMPATIVSLVGWIRWSDPVAVGKIADCLGQSVLQVTAVISVLYLIYAFLILRTLSHAFEFEADLMACCKPLDQASKVGSRNQLLICQTYWLGMQAAIERLAICMPSQVNKQSVLHPSLRARMRALQMLKLRSRSCPPERLIASNRHWLLAVAAFVASLIAIAILSI